MKATQAHPRNRVGVFVRRQADPRERVASRPQSTSGQQHSAGNRRHPLRAPARVLQLATVPDLTGSFRRTVCKSR